MSLTALKLITLLQRAHPEADVRFWVNEDTEADFDCAYDDETESDNPEELIKEGADVVNIDLTAVDYGGGEDPDDVGYEGPPWNGGLGSGYEYQK